MTADLSVPTAAFSSTARWRGLGTDIELAVTDSRALDEAVELATELIMWVDRSCSRFRSDSDLTRANLAAGTWTRVDPLLVDAVSAAVHVAEVTGGLVDPTLGRALVKIGYDQDFRLIRSGSRGPAQIPLPPARPVSQGWREVQFDPDGWVKVPVGTALDLGAVGKAFASDFLAQELSLVLGCGVVIGLGGDVAVAGQPPVTADGVGWPVRVDEDLASEPEAPTGPRSQEPSQVVLLPDGGIATSSTRKRSWRHRGRIVHHLLDPRTGRSVPRIWSEVTVRALTCVDANAGSTAAMVLGEAAPEWLDEAGLPSRLRHDDGTLVGTVGWPGTPRFGADDLSRAVSRPGR